MERTYDFGFDLPSVCRLGLTTRGNTHLDPDDVHHAVERGTNYLNWCGHVDGMSRAIRDMGSDRDRVIVAWQMQNGSSEGARRELDAALTELGTDRIDLVTLYYVESKREWLDIASLDGAYGVLADARDSGLVRMIGMTSHQREMAARIAAGKLLPESEPADGLDPSRPLDALMLRYNAALMETTPEDPVGYRPPAAPEWYRYAPRRAASPNPRTSTDN